MGLHVHMASDSSDREQQGSAPGGGGSRELSKRECEEHCGGGLGVTAIGRRCPNEREVETNKMSDPVDPALWKVITDWLWALLIVPIGMAWRKIASAPSKEDFLMHVAEDKTAHEEFRVDMREMFRSAEADRRFTRDYFDKMTEKNHDMHVEFLKEFSKNR